LVGCGDDDDDDTDTPATACVSMAIPRWPALEMAEKGPPAPIRC
jgi:hypothetical protein